MTTTPEDSNEFKPDDVGGATTPPTNESPTGNPSAESPGAYYSGQQGFPPAPRPGQGVDDSLQRIQLNGWLSAFFGIIPALIFFVIDKERSNPLVRDFHQQTLNFSIIRAIIGLLAFVPVIGWLIGVLGGIVCFVIAIMAAVKAPDEYRAGQAYKYPFNFAFVS
ncbi:DUF4870 domain-containing protein [Glutamicibacter sp.]|uniref:DUF4870 domain-containing protein n=1 Tax=Glutamicibacter sp. TaxID=1931995 RepID=UPI002B48BE87|nr:DUF4870 domain-containing protein [Glutamicibacter sp.]HJX79469.1 DUF4870 domain-containing protein [Glutamicibacter sp.]